ncbi:MAG: class I SAM-dependent methyltransferase [Chloroflexota bacterium]
MDEQTVAKLVQLNRDFYQSFAQPFAETRATPQPGFARLVGSLSPGPHTVLDIGCGDGRFGRFLRDSGVEISYTGVDLTPQLLVYARSAEDDILLTRDINREDSLSDLPKFSCIACLSTLQHIPGHANRVRLLREMGEHLTDNGIMFLGNWQFMDSERQRRKLRDWEIADIDAHDVGQEDFLLSWNRGGSGLRYVAYLDEPMTRQLAHEAGLQIIESFRSDGREGNLNLYSILTG